MAAMVAHEFNNILTPVISYAQMAQSNPKLTGKALTRAADGGQRATRICKAILGLAGRDAAHRQEQLALKNLIERTVDAMAREPQRDCIELFVDVPSDLTILADAIEMQQVLLNLLLNARSALLQSPGLRRLTIRAERRKQGIVLSIADTGTGIAPENLQRIFEPFFSTRTANVDPSGESERGNGLGLAICRDIVTAMGGRIEVTSQLNQGTTFTLHLPA
jgi:two-component system NtrC family sensor kinase